MFTADAAHPRARNRDAVVQACRDVAGATGQAIAAGRIPVLVGGDCSITAGAVSGCLAQRPDTGLLYLDGDADPRTRLRSHGKEAVRVEQEQRRFMTPATRPHSAARQRPDRPRGPGWPG